MSTAAPTPEQLRIDLAAQARGVVHVGVDADLAAVHTHANLLNLTALHNPDQGRLALVARPAERRTGWVLRDVLATLGIDDSSDKRGDDTYRDLARTWLLTRRTRHLFITSCERLHPDSITELATLAAATDITLWLLTTGVADDALHDTIATWTAATITWAELADAFADVPELFHPAHRTTTTTTPAAPLFPTTVTTGDVFPRVLPYEDFPTFRTACARVLTGSQAELVDTQLRLDATLAGAMFDALQRPVTEADVATHLHSRYRELPTDAEILVATRGTQIAAFTRGWLLKVDTHGLLAAAADNPRPASRSTAHWERLRHYPDPATGTICALAGTDLDARTIAALTLGAVAPDGSTVTVDGHPRDVELGARTYLRAMVLLRRIHGAGPNDSFLASPDGNTLGDRVGATTLNRVRVETGLALTSRFVARERLIADRWTTRNGISLQSLTAGASV